MRGTTAARPSKAGRSSCQACSITRRAASLSPHSRRTTSTAFICVAPNCAPSGTASARSAEAFDVLANSGVAAAVPSTHRRDLWPSRAEAAAKYKSNKFYQSWDPRVLDLWIQHGLRQLPTEIHPATAGPGDDPRVTLTTSKHQELFTFLRPDIL